MRSGSERGELGCVGGQHAPSAPDAGAFEAAYSGPAPAVLALQRRDAALGTGAPLDEFDEAGFGLDVMSGGAGLSLPKDRDVLDADLGELNVDCCFAVAAIRGDRVGVLAGDSDGPLDGGCESGCIGGNPGFEFVVDNDPVDGVGDLAGVAELGRVRQAASADRASITVVQRHSPRLARRHLAGKTHPGLSNDLFERIDEMIEISKHSTEPFHWTVTDSLRVQQHASRLADTGVGKVRQLAGDRQHFVIALWGFALDSVVGFWGLAWLVAVCHGGSQALSRSLFTRLIPIERSGEYLGFFSIVSKFASFFSPLLFVASVLRFNSSRPTVGLLSVFFGAGIWLLRGVDVERGQAAVAT